MKKNQLVTVLGSFILLIMNCQADEICDQHSQNNVIVDSHPLPFSIKEKMQKRRKAESKKIEESLENGPIQLAGLIIPIKNPNHLIALASDQLNTTASHYSPYIYHWIDSFPISNIIKTEDGAEWICNKNDEYLLKSWNPGNTIVVSPKNQWLWGSNYQYVLTNKDIDPEASINVNLSLGPKGFGQFSSWIVGIDKNVGQVYVLNGQGERTVWEIAKDDLYLFNEWAINETLIIGQNTDYLWWFSEYVNILINADANHFVHAKQISGKSKMKCATEDRVRG